VLEAQMAGTPVLAPQAAPFTETVLEGRTGFMYRDPREDAGADFEKLIKEIKDGKVRPDPLAAREHLERFSYPAFAARVKKLLHAIRT
jgi:glycosyltransferase involved in cell wall biosynthesis